MVRTILPPLVAAYALFAGLAWHAWRHPVSGKAGPSADVSAPGLVRHVVMTASGGFVAFLAIVAVFHVWLAGQRAAFMDALTGGGFLAASAAAAFLALSAAERRLRR